MDNISCISGYDDIALNLPTVVPAGIDLPPVSLPSAAPTPDDMKERLSLPFILVSPKDKQ